MSDSDGCVGSQHLRKCDDRGMTHDADVTVPQMLQQPFARDEAELGIFRVA